MKIILAILSVTLMLSMAACHSTQLRIPTDPVGATERSTGIADGTSTGFMLFGFIPIKQNDRFQAAYNAALIKSGGSRLTDMTVSEKWFWTPVGGGFIFRVQGTGVANK